MKAIFDTKLSKPITTLNEAKAWIRALVDEGLLFHFEDSPYDVVDATTNERTFSDEEAMVLACQLDALPQLRVG